MKHNFLVAVALFVTMQATAQFNTFRGAGFEVNYPASFKAHSAPGSLEMNLESVFFSSPDNLVEFYIFSPAQYATASDIALKANEKQSTVQTTNGKTTIAKFWTITAKDNSYERTYQESMDVKSGVNWVIGLKYKNQAAFTKYRNEYLAFKTSYHKTALDNAGNSSAATPKLDAMFGFEEKEDTQTGGTLSTVYLLYNGNKYKLGIMHGTADNIDKLDFVDKKIPSTAIAACGAWYAGSGSYYYIIQKGNKLLLYQGYNGEEDPKISWQKVKEF